MPYSVTDETLPWDVYATPITARKFARLVRRGDGIAFLPAFFQANSAPYTAASHATCELGEPHAAPDTECTCGFYAVDNDDDLWRLSDLGHMLLNHGRTADAMKVFQLNTEEYPKSASDDIAVALYCTTIGSGSPGGAWRWVWPTADIASARPCCTFAPGCK